MHIRFPTRLFKSHRLDSQPRKTWQAVTLWRPRFGRLEGSSLGDPLVLLLPGRWLTRVSCSQFCRIWKKP